MGVGFDENVMTCPHCQTWILDDDHRCRRCGRRVRSAPVSQSGERFPFSNDATARKYDAREEFSPAPRASDRVPTNPAEEESTGQQTLFANPNPSRIIAFDSVASPTEREAMRARIAEAIRPRPLQQAKVEVRHARASRKVSTDQQRLDFFGSEEVLSPPQSNIICDAPVAPTSMRVQASVIDGLVMLGGMALMLAGMLYAGGSLSFDKHSAPFLLLALLTIPVFYKLIWVYMGRDSFGMRSAGLCLVDFDGNPPSKARRYHRLLGSFVSLLAAGIGLVWALLDEDALTWHDYISGTFPTIHPDY
jgi:uncharacterized RDD family membrane protein YckC